MPLAGLSSSPLKFSFTVRYTDELLARLCKPIESLDLPPVDRLGIQGDAFAVARAGMLPTTRVLNLLNSYKNEENYTVFCDLTTNLGNLATLLGSTEYYPTFCTYAASLYENVCLSVQTDLRLCLTTLLVADCFQSWMGCQGRRGPSRLPCQDLGSCCCRQIWCKFLP